MIEDVDDDDDDMIEDNDMILIYIYIKISFDKNQYKQKSDMCVIFTQEKVINEIKNTYNK